MTTVTVVIVTKNRKEDLRVAVKSALQQTAKPEVIVIDDGSTDGSAAMVREEFPAVRLIRHDHSQGVITRRNEGAREASGALIFSIDDDAEFVSPNTIAQTLNDFGNPKVGAVAIPYVEPQKGATEDQRAPDRTAVWVTDCFIGTSYAIRKEVFLAVGGYRDTLVHQGEERDYCLRMMAAGFFVRLGNADAIMHYESPKRDKSRMDYYGRRNDILFVWHYVPLAQLLPHLVGTTFNAVTSAMRAGRYVDMFKGTASGYVEVLSHLSDRAPVSASVYELHRWLKKKGPRKLECCAI